MGNQWLHWLAGTPRNLLRTIGVAAIIVVLIHPPILVALTRRLATVVGQALGEVITQFIAAVNPLIYPVFVIAICVIGYRMIWRGIAGGRRRKKFFRPLASSPLERASRVEKVHRRVD